MKLKTWNNYLIIVNQSNISMFRPNKDFINSIVERVLSEVRYINATPDYRSKQISRQDPMDAWKQEPIKNSETIRVFHGCDLATAVKIAKQGVSGQEWTPRKYSYEQGMNPVGLFVTTDFNKVKDFANPFHGGKEKNAAIILEFSVKASQLDTPVWNGQDSYFGQYSNPQPFRSKEERDAQKQHYNDKARQSEYDYVRNSDNPAMANSIFNNSEHQALFLGSLTPDMIKRFWVQPFNGNVAQSQTYQPMNLREFLKVYGDDEYYDQRTGYRGQIDYGDKLYGPKEDFTGLADFGRRFMHHETDKRPQWHKRKMERYNNDEADYIADIVDNAQRYIIDNPDPRMLQAFMWPKQIRQAIGDEKYMEFFDRFGIGMNQNESVTYCLESTVRLNEFMEVWRNPEINKLAKQIFVDFKEAAAAGNEKAAKSYTFQPDNGEEPVKVNVKVKLGGSTRGNYSPSNRALTVLVDDDISLQSVQSTLFHELTHNIDHDRNNAKGGGLLISPGTYSVGGRTTRGLEIVNELLYYLFRTTERNAWQSEVVKGREAVDKHFNYISGLIKELENKSFKYEDQVFPMACKEIFGKILRGSTGRELNYAECKRRFLDACRQQLDQLKRRTYKNLLAYNDVRDDNLEGITADPSVLQQVVNGAVAYARFIMESVDVVAEDIVKHYLANIQKGYFSPDTDGKAFSLAYTPYGTKINIKVTSMMRRPSKLGFDGKALYVWCITASDAIENAVIEFHLKNEDGFWKYRQQAIDKVKESILKNCPPEWGVKD